MVTRDEILIQYSSTSRSGKQFCLPYLKIEFLMGHAQSIRHLVHVLIPSTMRLALHVAVPSHLEILSQLTTTMARMLDCFL